MNNRNKLTKNELKDIVKACLVEILEEGLLKNSNLTESKSRKTTSTRKSQLNGSSEIKRKRSHLDKKTSSPKIKTNLSDDNLINEMLADTARSTLQEQIAADRNKNASAVAGGDYAAKKVASSELNDLFGDAAGKWSQLAFFDKN